MRYQVHPWQASLTLGQTAVAIMVVVMAAACHPEAQNVVQEELDNVIGRDKGTHLLRAEAVYQLTAFT